MLDFHDLMMAQMEAARKQLSLLLSRDEYSEI